MNKILPNVLFAVFLVLIADNAYAYIDPGSGSYVFQIVAGAFLGTLFTCKFFIRKLFNWKTNNSAKNPSGAVKTETGSSNTGDDPVRAPFDEK